MKTRPVFESFSDFVDFLNFSPEEGKSSLNIFEAEGITVEEFNSRLSSFFDNDAKKAFLGLKNAIQGSPFYLNPDNEFQLDDIKKDLTYLAKTIENYQKEEDTGGVKIEYVGAADQDIAITQVVNGQIKLVSLGNRWTNEKQDGFKENSWADLNTVLATVAKKNLDISFPVELKDKKWQVDKATKYISGAGAQDQLAISDISAGINFVTIPANAKVSLYEPGTNVNGMGNLDITYPKDEQKRDSVQRLLVLYTLKRILKGQGDVLPTSYIKKVFVDTVVPGEKITTERNIKGTDKMFAQGESTLKDDQLENIKIAIDNLLSDFISIDSIVITGGASFEGGLDVNKKLVVERATTVKDLVEEIHPELKGKVTINESDDAKTGKFSKIQSKDVPAEYPEWRKIYLNVTGTVQGDPSVIKEQKDVLVGGKIRSDKAILTQWVIGFDFNRV